MSNNFENNTDKTIRLNLSLIFDENGYKDDYSEIMSNNHNVEKIILYCDSTLSQFTINEFIFNCNSLTTICIECPLNIISIGDCVFSSCVNLQYVEGFNLLNVTSIGDYFLSFCKLKTFDNINLSNVTSIGYSFCSCAHFETVNAKAFCNVDTIGSNFFIKNSKLISFDSSSLTKLICVDKDFFLKCQRIEIIISNSNYCFNNAIDYKKHNIVEKIRDTKIYLSNNCVI